MTGEELREHRQRMKLTQQRLGELCGYKGKAALTTVQRWEYGTRPIPIEQFRKLAEILEIPVEKFIP